LATVHKKVRQTLKLHKICHITQQSEKYNITNSCLLDLVDNLETKTDKDDFFSMAAIQSQKVCLQVASTPEHSIKQRVQRKIAVEMAQNTQRNK